VSRPVTIIDTGPIVAYLDAGDRHHNWATEQFEQTDFPALTCDAVLVEAFHVLRRVRRDTSGLLAMLERGAFISEFRMLEHGQTLAALLRKYADVPMSLANACLVRMVELAPDARVMTLDSDFRIYRQHGRRQIPLIMPDEL
jgi:uncharacterized protein